MDRYATLRHGLVAAWCPSLGVGSVIQDRARSNNGTATSVTPRAMTGGTAIEFNGTSSVVTSSTAQYAINGATYASQSMWMWKPAANTTCASGFSNSPAFASSGFKRFGAIWFSDGVVYSIAENGASAFHEVPNNTSGWMHLVLVFNGSQPSGATRLAVYINGTQRTPAGTPAIPATLSVDLGDYTLGKDSSDRFSAGRLDDVRVYNRVLTLAEIRLLASQRGIGLVPTRHRRGSLLSQFWLNVGGTWKTAKPWLNVGGTWRQGTPKIRASGTWKG